MSLVNTIKDLRQQRAAAVDGAGKLLTKAQEEKRELTAEETQEFERRHQDADALLARIKPLEKQLEAERDLEHRDLPPSPEEDPEEAPERRKVEEIDPEVRSQVVRAWALGDYSLLASKEERAAAAAMGYTPGHFNGSKSSIRCHLRGNRALRKRQAELRAQSLAATKGVELTADDRSLVDTIDDAMLAFGGVRNVAEVLRTRTGESLPVPNANDTSNKAVLVAEGGNLAAETDLAFDKKTLDAFTYRSLIKASWEFLQDAAIDAEDYIGRKLGERIARGTSEHFVVGTGSGQPNGLVTAAPKVNTAGVGAFVFNDLLTLKHSVDPAYRAMGATWAIHDSILLTIKKFVDADNRPLWQAGIAVGEPDRIDGDPYVILQEMDSAVTTGNDIVAYGHMRKFLIRDVTEVTVQVLRELYSEDGEIGFLVFSRHDSELSDAGTNPVKALRVA